MIIPIRPKSGATIGIFTPSEPLVEYRRERFDNSMDLLRANGFKIIYGENIFAHKGYMAGTVAQRVDDIHRLAQNPGVDVLLACTGGKSCNQLLDRIDYKLIADCHKAILGFSDGCVLLNAITQKTGLITFNGPNVAYKLNETRHADLGLLVNPRRKANLLGKVSDVNCKTIKSGKALGRVFGGNLSTFCLGVAGSEYCPDFNSGIFYWESGFERPQIVDQYLTFLKNLGFFEKLGGMIIGDFIKEEPEEFKRVGHFDMLNEVLSDYDFPVMYCPTFGHLPSLENPILPVGLLCEMDADNFTLSDAEPYVSG